MTLQCNICKNTKNTTIFRAKEMMYGTHELFEYLHCPQCETLQLYTPVSDMSVYYPKDYISFSTQPNYEIYEGLLGYLHKKRDAYPILHEGISGRLLYKIKPSLQYSVYDYLNIKREDRILDVGAGNGRHLRNLNRICGLTNLTGIDPYIEEDIHFPNGIKLLKRDIFEIDGEWDIILFHCSFEHMKHPVKVMKQASSLLKKGGVCMLVVPICNTYACIHYKENWVQLDPPRHLYIYSEKSCKLLGEMSGLHLEYHFYNSTAFQFTGSELYKRGIPFCEMNNQHFSKKELRRFRREAEKLNKEKEGDLAAFYFRKP